METAAHTQDESVNRLNSHAANLLINEKRTGDDVVADLMAQGLDAEAAAGIVTNLQEQIERVKQDRAGKDMLYGALWCIGGTVLTVADTGFIFWGAILFGGIQFFKGLFNRMG